MNALVQRWIVVLAAVTALPACVVETAEKPDQEVTAEPPESGEGGDGGDGGGGEDGGIVWSSEPWSDSQLPTGAPSAEQVRVVTANISFALTPAKVKQDFQQYGPEADVVLMQEARDVILENLVDTSVWAVRQNTTSPAKRGSAIVVRKAIAEPGGVGKLVLRKGVEASPCPGGGINTRYIARVNVRLASGRMLRLASAHMPPKRCWGPVYDAMADRIVEVSNEVPGRYVIGADWNKVVANDPNDIGQRTGLKRRAPGNSIDGFYFRNDELDASTAAWLPKTSSDHKPVRIHLTID